MKMVYRIQAAMFMEIELIANDEDDAWERAKEISITDPDWKWKAFDLYDSQAIGQALPDYPNPEDERHGD